MPFVIFYFLVQSWQDNYSKFEWFFGFVHSICWSSFWQSGDLFGTIGSFSSGASPPWLKKGKCVWQKLVGDQSSLPYTFRCPVLKWWQRGISRGFYTFLRASPFEVRFFESLHKDHLQLQLSMREDDQFTVAVLGNFCPKLSFACKKQKKLWLFTIQIIISATVCWG